MGGRMLLFLVRRMMSVMLRWMFWAREKMFAASYPPLPPVTDPVLLQSTTTLAKLIREGKITSERVVTSYIHRAQAVNPTLNAVIDERYETAIKEAQEVDRKLSDMSQEERVQLKRSQPLLGIPVSCKEIVRVKGLSLTGGLLSRKGMKSPEDAEVITRMREAGAIPICVTNIPELSMWIETSNSVYGITNNPYNVLMSSGGSSGGEGALLAACGTALSIGTDVGGSIRIPSHLCGVFGHKPSSQWVSTNNVGVYRGNMENARTSVVGPMTRYAPDLTLALEVMAPVKAKGMRSKVDNTDLGKVEILWSEDLDTPLLSPTDPSLRKALYAALNYLNCEFGSPLKKLKWPRDMTNTFFVWSNKMTWEFGHLPPYTEDLADRKGEISLLKEWALFVCGMGRFTLGMLLLTTFQYINRRGKKVAPEDSPHYWKPIQDAMLKIVREGSVIIMPTLPKVSYYKHELTFNFNDCNQCGFFNAMEMPVTVVPMGLAKCGQPMSLQVIAAPEQDHLCLAIAEALEKKFGGWVSPAKITVLQDNTVIR